MTVDALRGYYSNILNTDDGNPEDLPSIVSFSEHSLGNHTSITTDAFNSAVPADRTFLEVKHENISLKPKLSSKLTLSMHSRRLRDAIPVESHIVYDSPSGSLPQRRIIEYSGSTGLGTSDFELEKPQSFASDTGFTLTRLPNYSGVVTQKVADSDLRYIILNSFSPSTSNYLLAVEAADGQELENEILAAMGTFAEYRIPLGGTSCIMAGARTLAGALVPMVGAAPTNFNFVSGDYNRKTGLVGNGSTKYLDSNRNNNADPQDSHHIAVRGTPVSLITNILLGAQTRNNGTGGKYAGVGVGPSARFTSVPTTNVNQVGPFVTLNTLSFFGLSRSGSASYTSRASGSNTTHTEASASPVNLNLFVFAFNNGGTAFLYTGARLSFYSIGESLDLTLLDARVTTLMNAFAAAIP